MTAFRFRSALALPLSVLALSCAPGAARPAVAPPPAPTAARPVPAAAPPDPSQDLAARIDPLFADFAKPGSPGCAVGVYRAGEIAFAKGYGEANLEYGLPITKDSVFDVGSVSKQFTGAAIALLVQEGKLSLDDDIRKYVPEVPIYAKNKPITLAHLLHHTSGLRDYAGILSFSGFDDADYTNDDDALFAVAHQKTLNFPTGTEWSYSNTGYFLMSLVVKRVTGKSLGVFAKERIFDPLGMKSTFYLDDHMTVIPRRAEAYAPGEHGTFGVAMSDFEQTGDGSVQTTIEDLARWDANFQDPKVGGRAMIDMLRTPGKLDDGKPLTYAIGLVETTTNGIGREEHAGAWAGYRADILRFPSEKVTVVCLCNVASGEPEGHAEAVAEVVLPKLVAVPAASHGPAAVPASPTTAATPTMPKASAADVAAIVGAYIDPDSLDVRTIALEGGVIQLGFQVAPGGGHRELEAVDGRTFAVKPEASEGTIMTRYIFQPAAKVGPAHLTRLPVGGKATTLQRFEPITLTPAALHEYEGRYASDEIPRDWQLQVVDGKLQSGLWGRGAHSPPLVPLMRDVFAAPGVSFRFTRDAKGRVQGFTFGADRVRGIRWVRR